MYLEEHLALTHLLLSEQRLMHQVKQRHACRAARDANQIEIILPDFEVGPERLLKAHHDGLHEAWLAYFVLLVRIVGRPHAAFEADLAGADELFLLVLREILEAKLVLVFSIFVSVLAFKINCFLLCFFRQVLLNCCRLLII